MTPPKCTLRGGGGGGQGNEDDDDDGLFSWSGMEHAAEVIAVYSAKSNVVVAVTKGSSWSCSCFMLTFGVMLLECIYTGTILVVGVCKYCVRMDWLS